MYTISFSMKYTTYHTHVVVVFVVEYRVILHGGALVLLSMVVSNIVLEMFRVHNTMRQYCHDIK